MHNFHQCVQHLKGSPVNRYSMILDMTVVTPVLGPMTPAEEKPLVFDAFSPRRCNYCGASSTPMWRHGPGEYVNLCNSCGVKWRRGKILQNTKYRHHLCKPVQKKQLVITKYPLTPIHSPPASPRKSYFESTLQTLVEKVDLTQDFAALLQTIPKHSISAFVNILISRNPQAKDAFLQGLPVRMDVNSLDADTWAELNAFRN